MSFWQAKLFQAWPEKGGQIHFCTLWPLSSSQQVGCFELGLDGVADVWRTAILRQDSLTHYKDALSVLANPERWSRPAASEDAAKAEEVLHLRDTDCARKRATASPHAAWAHAARQVQQLSVAVHCCCLTFLTWQQLVTLWQRGNAIWKVGGRPGARFNQRRQTKIPRS